MRHARCQALAGGLVAASLLGATAAAADGRAGEKGAVAETVDAVATDDDGTAESPAALVAAMSTALRTLNYEGTFVHLQGMHVSSMHILHAYDGGGELERMISLDGEAREVIRNHSLVTCIWPGSDAVVVSKAKPRKLLPDVDAALADGDRYRLEHVGRDRVAGVATDVVEVAPRDGFRYGYRFWIDRRTRMLLRSMLLDGARAVEQVLFTAIDYPERIDRARFEVAVDEERISWVEPAAARAGRLPSFELPPETAAAPTAPSEPSAAGQAAEPAADRVRFARLPAGYSEISETYRAMPFDSGPVSHAMVSDGMASVSVYVEHVAADAQDTGAAGLSSMGAMNAFGLSLEKGFVTVVGEVPADTVRAIAEAVRLVE